MKDYRASDAASPESLQAKVKVEERRYDPEDYQKHKRPKGWGSLCPDDLGEAPQSLLDTGVQDGDQIYNVSGEYAVAAQSHSPGVWHGYPIPWRDLPADAKTALIKVGRLSKKVYDKAYRKNWGEEFKQ